MVQHPECEVKRAFGLSACPCPQNLGMEFMWKRTLTSREREQKKELFVLSPTIVEQKNSSNCPPEFIKSGFGRFPECGVLGLYVIEYIFRNSKKTAPRASWFFGASIKIIISRWSFACSCSAFLSCLARLPL